MTAAVRHLRARDGGSQPTTAVELLFDLVYVIAVTQISHLVIIHDVSLASLARAGFLLVVVWWAWVYTTWMVNWFDPRSQPVRLVLVLCGLGSLLMSAALPLAFGADALLFALAYVALQVGRNASATRLLTRPHALRLTFERITAWSVVSAGLWIAGAILAEGRWPLWGAALIVELIAPATGYATPGLGRAETTDWAIEGGHFAERFQAFIIIALGESIAVTGTTVLGPLHGGRIVALAIAFLQTGAMWWLYFGEVAEHSRRHLATAEDAGRLGRDAYTYLHLPIVAGIILVAVADHFLILDPGQAPSGRVAAVMVSGPALYLVGESLFRLRMIGSVSGKRVSTVIVIVACGALATALPAVALTALLTAVLTGLGVAESPGLRSRLLRMRAEGVGDAAATSVASGPPTES